MNSGIKRGLAVTAISALAITGAPFLASSASAIPGRTITLNNVDGPAFDVDEYVDGEVRVLVRDNGVPLAVGTLDYTLTFSRFNASTTNIAPVSDTATITAGSAVIPLTTPPNGDGGTFTLNSYIDDDGTAGRSSGDTQNVSTFKVGDSTLAFADASPATSPAGGSKNFDASLKLADGTPLPGRGVDFTFTPGTGGNAAVSTTQPAGTTRNSATSASDITDNNGVVTVALSDPATPAAGETGGKLDADTTNNPGTGSLPSGNPDEDAADLTVNFVQNAAPAGTTITIAPITSGKPGVAVDGSLTVVSDADNNPATPATPVSGLAVNLGVDKGFFTDGTNDPAAPPAGADTGELKSLGNAITVVTDAAGKATFQTAIERDAGFDDDGKVKATVGAVVGSFSDTEDIDYDSSNPLNGGAVSLVLTPDAAQSNPVNPTRVGDDVAYDVFTTDQFGNRVGNEPVAITEDGANATATPASATSDFDTTGDVTVTSTETATVKVTGTWTQPGTTYTGLGTTTQINNEVLTDTEEARFYVADLEAATATLVSDPAGKVKVGRSVTETLTVVDQEGNPFSGLEVRFIRSGPSSQTGDTNVEETTNAAGKAFYSFVGTRAGTARISAVITDGTTNKTVTDSVVFNGAGRTRIVAKLGGKHNGARADVLKVNAPSKARGAKVKLYRFINNKPKLVATKRLNRTGDATFSVKDRNGRGVTRYAAVVTKTRTTKSDITNVRRVR